MIRKTKQKQMVEVQHIHCARCGEQLEAVTDEQAALRADEPPAADILIKFGIDGSETVEIRHDDLCSKCDGVVARAIGMLRQTKRGAAMSEPVE